MKIREPYRCDYCSTVKRGANHWWLRFKRECGPDFVLIPWERANPDSLQVEHICSESCAAKALTKWMAAQRINADTITKADISAGTVVSISPYSPTQKLTTMCEPPLEIDYSISKYRFDSATGEMTYETP